MSRSQCLRKGGELVFLAPMLTGGQEAPFADERYIYEPKLDGQRLILSMEHRHVGLYSKHGFDLTTQYPELHWVPVSNGEDIVLDGVIVAIDPDTGRVNPDLLMRRYRMKKRMDIQEASLKCPVHYFVFDILRYNGEDIRDWPLERRKKLLNEVLEDNRHFSQMPYLENQANSLFEALRKSTLAGIVAKDKQSEYHSGSNADWLLIQNYRYLNVRIEGYRKNQFGWLVRHGEQWRSIVADSVPAAYRQAFYGIAKVLVTGEDRNYVYVKPEIEACLRYVKQRPDGSPVQPEFVRFVV